MCRRFAPRCSGADFPCESKLPQINSPPHHHPSGQPIQMEKNTALRAQKQCLRNASVNLDTVCNPVFSGMKWNDVFSLRMMFKSMGH